MDNDDTKALMHEMIGRRVATPCVMCGYFQGSHPDFNPLSTVKTCPLYVPMDAIQTEIFFTEAKSHYRGVVGTIPFPFHAKEASKNT